VAVVSVYSELNMLAVSPKRCSEIYAACETAGVKSRTVEKAKKELGVVSIKKADGWYWEIGDCDNG